MLPERKFTWLIADFATGVYAPGYQERRRQRLKEKYGIDVPADV